MKTRIISASVGTVLLLAVLFCPWPWVFALVVAAAAGLATYELLHNTGIVKNAWMLWGSIAFAVLQTLAFSLWAYGGVVLAVTPIAVYTVYALVLFLLFHGSFVWKGVGLTLYAAVGFSAMGTLRSLPMTGLCFVMLPMVIAWISDTGAYFTGVFFGKHKMAPVISPKKTWEGFFGGWIISIGLTVLFGVICNAIMDSEVFDLLIITIAAAILAPLSVCGDLLASKIKRQCGIKDYGNIMPGHGGVMDRFDSVIFIAPLVLVALMLF